MDWNLNNELEIWKYWWYYDIDSVQSWSREWRVDMIIRTGYDRLKWVTIES